jgi:hypothetical protein
MTSKPPSVSGSKPSRWHPLSYDKRNNSRFHNQPETGSLSSAELATIETGRAALHTFSKTFELWVAIGHAVKTLRAKADRLGGRSVFKRLMAQNGFNTDPKADDYMFDAATASRLIQIVDNLPAVTGWHESLTSKQKREWASPSAVFKHCPIFAKKTDDAKKRLLPMAQLKQANIALQEENHLLRQREDRETFNPKTSSAREIAIALVDQLSPYKEKAERVAREMLSLIKERDQRTLNGGAPSAG